mmetsp:Transcript_2186/g.4857  ORF Transcript_2186/g.4857 Transcript_2186/m.4857 type:complete len:248 (+) Transcript_2186:2063-2806(+)
MAAACRHGRRRPEVCPHFLPYTGGPGRDPQLDHGKHHCGHPRDRQPASHAVRPGAGLPLVLPGVCFQPGGGERRLGRRRRDVHHQALCPPLPLPGRRGRPPAASHVVCPDRHRQRCGSRFPSGTHVLRNPGGPDEQRHGQHAAPRGHGRRHDAQLHQEPVVPRAGHSLLHDRHSLQFSRGLPGDFRRVRDGDRCALCPPQSGSHRVKPPPDSALVGHPNDDGWYRPVVSSPDVSPDAGVHGRVLGRG